MLNLAEELFLLSIHDEKGGVMSSVTAQLKYGLAGCFLCDLALMGRLGLHEKKLVVLDNTPTGDQFLDQALATIDASGSLKKARYWIITAPSDGSRLEKRLAECLVEKGIFRRDDKRYQLVIPGLAFPERKASAKYWIKHNLREIALTDLEPSPRAAILLSLVMASGLLSLVFTKDERSAVVKRVASIQKAELLENPAEQALREILDAVGTISTAAAMK